MRKKFFLLIILFISICIMQFLLGSSIVSGFHPGGDGGGGTGGVESLRFGIADVSRPPMWCCPRFPMDNIYDATSINSEFRSIIDLVQNVAYNTFGSRAYFFYLTVYQGADDEVTTCADTSTGGGLQSGTNGTFVGSAAELLWVTVNTGVGQYLQMDLNSQCTGCSAGCINSNGDYWKWGRFYTAEELQDIAESGEILRFDLTHQPITICDRTKMYDCTDEGF